MKLCIVGLGSMGRRHLHNLPDVLRSRGHRCEIDVLRHTDSSLAEAEDLMISKQYTKMEDLPNDYDVFFITNPTSLHFETICQAASKTKHLFVEKPIAARTDIDLGRIPFSSEGIGYVACPMRYMEAMEYLKEYIADKNVFSARAICSTYLPEWRAGVDYRDVYSAKKELGGGVAIDLIHEWDYLCHLFGMPLEVRHFQGTFSNLEISSEDIAVYIARYPDKLISLHLDYFGRYPKREIEIYLEDRVVVGDFISNQVYMLGSGDKRVFTEARDEYQKKELHHFFDIIDGKTANDNDFARALNVLKIAKGEK